MAAASIIRVRLYQGLLPPRKTRSHSEVHPLNRAQILSMDRDLSTSSKMHFGCSSRTCRGSLPAVSLKSQTMCCEMHGASSTLLWRSMERFAVQPAFVSTSRSKQRSAKKGKALILLQLIPQTSGVVLGPSSVKTRELQTSLSVPSPVL